MNAKEAPKAGTHEHLGGYVHGHDPNTWYPELWSWLKTRLRLNSVLDVGCGEGHSTAYWSKIGLLALGLEGSPDALRDTAAPGLVVHHDFTSGPYRSGRRFDAVWCCEVVEHIEEAYVDHVLDTFALADTIVMTHALPGQVGHHHVNCQPSLYWAEKLATRGYHLQYGLTRQARAHAHSYFTQTGMIFMKRPPAIGPDLALVLLRAEWLPRRLLKGLRKRGLRGAAGKVGRLLRG